MSNTVICRVIKTHRDFKGRIIGYKIQSASGEIADIKSEPIKEAIMNGKVLCENLKLTSDNRLISGVPLNSTFEKIANTIASKTTGHREKTITNNFKYIAQLDADSMLYASLDVSSGIYFKNSGSNIEIKIISETSINDVIHTLNKKLNSKEDTMDIKEFNNTVPDLKAAAKIINEYELKTRKDNSCVAKDIKNVTISILIVDGTRVVSAVVNDDYTIREIHGQQFYTMLDKGQFRNIDRDCSFIKGEQKPIIVRNDRCNEYAVLDLLVPSITSGDFVTVEDVLKYNPVQISEEQKSKLYGYNVGLMSFESANVDPRNKQVLTTKKILIVITRQGVRQVAVGGLQWKL